MAENIPSWAQKRIDEEPDGFFSDMIKQFGWEKAKGTAVNHQVWLLLGVIKKHLISTQRRVEKLEARPAIFDAGIFSNGKSYAKGAGVSHSGSFWIAQNDTAARPGESTDWRLAIKRGAAGRDADPHEIAKHLLPEVLKALEARGE